MKWSVLLVSIALAMTPMAIANGDGSYADHCRDAPDAQDCKEDYCEDHPDACEDGADRSDANKTRSTENRADRVDCKEHQDKCQEKVREYCEDNDDARCDKAREHCKNNPDADFCETDDGFKLDALKHVSFLIDREAGALRDVSVGDRTIFTAILFPSPPEDAEMEGRVLEIEGADWELRLHDNPTGLLSYEGEGTLTLVLPRNVDISLTDNGARLAYGDRMLLLTSKGVTQDGNQLFVQSPAKLHVPPAGTQVKEISDAIEERKLGGEVRLKRDASETYAYDDVDIEVTTPDRIDEDTPMRVVLSAELTEGRTFVLDVDEELLSGPDLVLRYYDVNDDGTETEVVFRQAGSLQDVLEAGDDGGQPEYWIVKDDNGLQVMVSVPHWSTHAVTLASIGEFVTQPSVLIGVGAGLAGVGIAALGMFRPRKD